MATAATAFVVIAATITATVASATAAFATHHFHQFLNFFVSSRTAFNHFAFKDEIGACQRMVEVNDYYIRFDFYYAGIYALTVTGHQRYDITLFDMVAVELAVNLKDIFREINHVLLVILTVCLVCRNGEVKFVTFRKRSYLVLEVLECCS